ncbi:MAG: hypothetical protein QM648_04950 [Solirubrobacterales bacterium]
MESEFVFRLELVERPQFADDLTVVDMELATVTLDELGIPTTLGIMMFAQQISDGSGLGVRVIPRFPDPIEYNSKNDHLWIMVRKGKSERSIGAPVAVFLRGLDPVAIEIYIVSGGQ